MGGAARGTEHPSARRMTPAQKPPSRLEIAHLQAAMGLSLTTFAARVGVSRDTVVKWKAGRATPRLRKPLRILRRLMKEWGIE